MDITVCQNVEKWWDTEFCAKRNTRRLLNYPQIEEDVNQMTLGWFETKYGYIGSGLAIGPGGMSQAGSGVRCTNYVSRYESSIGLSQE